MNALVAALLVLVPVFDRLPDYEWFDALLQSALYVGFSSFTFVTSLVAKEQADAREEQRRLNAELRATRALLAESSKMAERGRISRELHDLVGHHLTALSLNLEVASHMVTDKAQEHVRQAHTLAKLLLTDVREAVSQLREGGAIDLGAALRPLAENIPKLAIEMDIDDPLTVDDPGVVVMGKEPILQGEAVVGYVASANFGYTAGKSIILAYLPVDVAESGQGLAVEYFGERYAVTRVDGPLLR